MSTVTLQIPKKHHSKILGKEGSVVKDLQRKYNVKVTIPRRDEATNNSITIIGKVPDVEKTKVDIEKLVGFKVSSSPLVKASVAIPKNKHGALLGKQGSTLRDLEARFSVSIAVPNRDDESDVVEFEGYESGVTGLKAEIAKLLGLASLDVKAEAEQKPVERTKLELSAAPINEAFFFPEKDGVQFQRFLDYLYSAKKTLDICVFTVTDDSISRVIETVFGQGVKVRVITDDDTSTQQGSDIQEFAELGIEVKMDHSPFHMHHKFVVVDGVLLMNGSFNWTKQARESNCENIMITNNADFVKQYTTQFEKMWNDTQNFFYVKPTTSVAPSTPAQQTQQPPPAQQVAPPQQESSAPVQQAPAQPAKQESPAPVQQAPPGQSTQQTKQNSGQQSQQQRRPSQSGGSQKGGKKK